MAVCGTQAGEAADMQRRRWRALHYSRCRRRRALYESRLAGGGAHQALPPLHFTAVCHRRRLTAVRRDFVLRCASSAPEGARRGAREHAVLMRGWSCGVAHQRRVSLAAIPLVQHLRQQLHAVHVAALGSLQRFAEPVGNGAAGQFGARLPAEAAATSCASWRAHQRCTALLTTADRRPECCGGGAWREQLSDRHS